MKIRYFIATKFDYDRVIYPGVGPAFGRTLGWAVEDLSRLGESDFDVAVIDPRLQLEDIPHLEAYLRRPISRRRPLFFKITDPDTPATTNPAQRYTLEQANRAGVHYASAYDPAGPMKVFANSFTSSQLAPLPFAYDEAREIQHPINGRKRKILLSGAMDAKLYPLRAKLRKASHWNPVAAISVDRLEHPGYPDTGTVPGHDITGVRFISKIAQYTHMFLCPSVYEVELMKYVECAYAGAVPIGQPPNSLKDNLHGCFTVWSGAAWDLWLACRMPADEAGEIASLYRGAMKRLRNPSKVVAEFEAVAQSVV